MLMLYSIFKARRVIFLSPRAANYCSCNIPLIVWKIEKGNHAAIKNIRYLLHNLVLTLPMSAKSNQMCGDENTEEVWKVTFYSCNVYMDLWGAISFSKWCHMMSVCLMSFWLYNVVSTNPHNNFIRFFCTILEILIAYPFLIKFINHNFYYNSGIIIWFHFHLFALSNTI